MSDLPKRGLTTPKPREGLAKLGFDALGPCGVNVREYRKLAARPSRTLGGRRRFSRRRSGDILERLGNGPFLAHAAEGARL